jgi:SAM-dependent methyltransferase
VGRALASLLTENQLMYDIEKIRNRHGKIWLNIASSTGILEDFVNLDNHIFIWCLKAAPFLCRLLPKKYDAILADYRQALRKSILLRHDCRKPLPFPEESVDHILCSHFLEHIYPDETAAILRDCHRVLKRRATLHVIVPDLALQIEHYLKQEGSAQAADQLLEHMLLTRNTRPSVKYRFLELHGGFGLQHRWMYDRASMSRRIIAAGFSLREQNDTPSRRYRLSDGSLHLVAEKCSDSI